VSDDPKPDGRKNKRPSAWVYFIQAGGADGPIKIGIAGNEYERALQLQTAHYEELRVLGFVPLSDYSEKDFHRWYAEHRIRGEWFRPGPEILKFITTRAYKLKRYENGKPVEIQTVAQYFGGRTGR
jgi:hypothetical protein